MMPVVQNLYYYKYAYLPQPANEGFGRFSVFAKKSLVQVSWGQSPADRGAHLWLVRGWVSRWLRGAERWASENDDGCWNPFFFF